MRTFSHNYESDIKREQFELIRPELEGARRKTKPREIDMNSVFCAILYLVKGGIQWRMLPSDFPKRGIVRHYYDVWSEKKKDGSAVLTGVLKKIDGSAAGGWVSQGEAHARADRRAEREERLLRGREGL